MLCFGGELSKLALPLLRSMLESLNRVYGVDPHVTCRILCCSIECCESYCEKTKTLFIIIINIILHTYCYYYKFNS